MSRPEHSLQTQIKGFIRETVACEHQFMCFDRTRNHGGKQHMWEAQRGILAGQPDSVLVAAGVNIWVELKAGKNKPSDTQERIGANIRAAGGVWEWTNSVDGYRQILAANKIPLRGNAAVLAAHKDALLAAASPVKVPRTRKPRTSSGDASSKARTRRAAAIYARVVLVG